MKSIPIPFLAVLCGLPGVGKTTLARLLAARTGAVYLRIDTIEQVLHATGMADAGPWGYAMAEAVAVDNLRLGRCVIADCVNPVRDSRMGWQAAAAAGPARLRDIWVVCSDAAEHRRRIVSRVADIPGLVLPGWGDVTSHDFEPPDGACLRIDSARLTPAEMVDRGMAYLSS